MKNNSLKKYGDRLLFILAIAVLAAALIRYGTGKSAGFRTITPDIVFTGCWDSHFEKETLLKLINEFKDTHRGIKITLRSLSYEDLHNELLDYGEEKTPGDIIALDSLWVPELIGRKIIDLVPNYSLEVPLISFINVFYYNVELLKEAGFTRPPKNRSEFINYSKTLSNEEKGLWALTLGLNSTRGIYDDILPWIWSAGAEIIKDGKPVINSRPVVESLSFLASLESGGLVVPGAFSADVQKKLDDFISGRAAFMIAPASSTEFVLKHMGAEAFSVTTIPLPDNYAGKTFNASAGWTLGISTRSLYREEACLLADFIAGKAQALSERLFSIPGNNAPDPYYSKVRDIAITAESAVDLDGLPWEKLEGVFKEELASLFVSQSSPAETAAAIQKRWEDVILSMPSLGNN